MAIDAPGTKPTAKVLVLPNCQSPSRGCLTYDEITVWIKSTF
jgi:hypothetical protein